MYPTVTVEHLASVTSAIDDSDDMKIYEFDREVSSDVFVYLCTGGCTGTGTGLQYLAHEEVLAA